MYFLNINKPKGITSFDVIRYLRKRLNIKQIGHSGTLDPLASGVMQVAVGYCTKLLDYLDSDKTYVADIKFGYTSETFDEEGEKTFIKTPDFSKEQLIICLNSFLGKTLQTPPKYSAVKINGKKACDLARKNKDDDIKIAQREIEIYAIKLLDFENDIAKIEVKCKKGTYIRSLVNDLGEKLGCGAHLTDLKRTMAGNFKIESSNNLEDEVLKLISPLKCIHLEQHPLNDEEFQKILNGNFIVNNTFKNDDFILLTKDNKLVSIAKISDNLIKPKKIFKEK